MSSDFPNCWEIKKCGREKDGAKVAEFGECVASRQNLGHSCWAIAGTLCGDKVQGTPAQKERSCMVCSVYKDYNRLTGARGGRILRNCPEEENKYRQLMKAWLERNADEWAH